ncbi:MAG: hypothetical protein J5850_02230 [Clostridia bacterium]|nr:hypothetical protein [Clostridia bacterium]
MNLEIGLSGKPSDAHERIEKPDYSPLKREYSGKSPFRGDFHCHAATGGTSDGQTSLAKWREMSESLGLDFVGVLDHRQVRHLYLKEYSKDFFLCGTEPAIKFCDMNIPVAMIHYLMFFRRPEDLSILLDRYPDVYGFTGSEFGTEGHFEYRSVKRERFMEIIREVYDMGGFVSHPHPSDVMVSDNTLDYFFGDGVGFEVIYRDDKRITEEDYRLWTELLEMGKKPVITSTDDTHGAPEGVSINTVYLTEKTNDNLVDALRCGNLNGGKCGIKMCIGNTVQGGTCSPYDIGKPLLFEAGDLHKSVPSDHDYRLDILTDKGVAYSEKGVFPFTGALKTKPGRLFYRIEIYDLTEGKLFALSNPVYCV